jgi:cytoskeletal protein RodZ
MAQAPDDFFSPKEVENPEGGYSTNAGRTSAAPTPVEPSQVGILLRTNREEQGLSIDDMAVKTRIRDVHLISLEAGAIDKLPGNAFVSGFMRLYAKNLGILSDPLIERFLLEFEKQRQNLATDTFSSPEESKQRPNSGAIIGGIVGLVALSIAYTNFGNSDRTIQQLPAAPPAKVGEVVPHFVKKDRNEGKQDSSVLHFGRQEIKPLTVESSKEEAQPIKQKQSSVKKQTEPVKRPRTLNRPQKVEKPRKVVKKPKVEKPRLKVAKLNKKPKELVVLRPKTVVAPAQIKQKRKKIPSTKSRTPVVRRKIEKVKPKIKARVKSKLPIVDIKPYKAKTVKPKKKNVRKRVDDSKLSPTKRILNRYPEPIVDKQDLVPDSKRAVSLISKELVWVQIRNADGDVLKDMVMRPNHVFRVPSGMQFYAILGNAGGVQLRVGKKRLPFLGSPGEVISDLNLSAATLLKRMKKR